MTEYIIRLTDEQEAVLRARIADPYGPISWGLLELDVALRNQCIAALALYDQLVAEAKAASDD